MSSKLFLILFVLLPSFSHAQIPAHYYDSITNQTGAELKFRLHQIIKGHKEFPYSAKSTDVWDILKISDQDPNDSACVIGFYSGFSMNAITEYNKGQGWNREHIWAKSRGDFGIKKGVGTDFYYIRAADISTNSARNNRNFNNGGEQYVDVSGFYNGETNSFKHDSIWCWEPREEVKGDVARMMFYMAVRYEDPQLDLELTDSLFTKSSKAPLHASLSVLLEWHLCDPVDSSEIKRNNIVYSFQNNRNPFIDHPEWVKLIWKEIK